MVFRSLPTVFALFLFVALSAGCQKGAEPRSGADNKTVVYVVRHAEKVDDSEDPPLSEKGSARAAALGKLLGSEEIAALYATPFRRTQQTIEPLAQALTMVITVDSARPAQLARAVLDKHRGQAVVIAGHSNTVPRILKTLGIADPPALYGSDYGDLFVVEIDDQGTARMTLKRFGR